MSYRKQLEEIDVGLKKAWDALDVEAMKARQLELEGQMSEPDFWSDTERATRISQEAAELKQEVEGWEKIQSDIEEFSGVADMAESEDDREMLKQIEKDVDDLQKRFRALEFSMLFSGEYDKNAAIVSIHAGAGGTDAMDWAEMLFRMFTRFAEKKGWAVEMLEESRGEEAGYKRVTFAVRGRYAYGHLRSEAGVHRLVRISPFDAEKMRHTAFALVEVIPELDDVSDKTIEIDDKDLRIDTFASSGAGGQSVNTTNSAVRITHIPTNTVVSIQNERSQQQNKETAMRVLKSRLYQRLLEEQAEKIEEIKGGHKPPQWGNQIRSYVLHPYKMVKDHRTNTETSDVDAVLDGDLVEFIEAYLRQETASDRL